MLSNFNFYCSFLFLLLITTTSVLCSVVTFQLGIHLLYCFVRAHLDLVCFAAIVILISSVKPTAITLLRNHVVNGPSYIINHSKRSRT